MADGALKKKKAMASSFDDDLGDGFLASWKPGKLSCNAALDLDDSPPPKAAKKFNFASFDMDLDLDGGLNKLANFNLDLPDLDLAQKAGPSSKDDDYKEVKDAEVMAGTDTAKKSNNNSGLYCAPEKAESCSKDEGDYENGKDTQIVTDAAKPKRQNSNSGLHFVTEKADSCFKDKHKEASDVVMADADTNISPGLQCVSEKAESSSKDHKEVSDMVVMADADNKTNKTLLSGLQCISEKAESCSKDNYKKFNDIVSTADADKAADINFNSELHSVSEKAESCSKNKHKEVSDIVVMTDADNGTDSLAPVDHDVIDKAEAYSEVLENMCKMLKQKNEEVKDLMVRALVTNNSLLMLNSPLHEEKILTLERSTNKLLVEETTVEHQRQ